MEPFLKMSETGSFAEIWMTGIEPGSPASPAMKVDSLPLSHQGNPRIKHYTLRILFPLAGFSRT